MLFYDYADEQIKKLGDENFNKLVQREANRLFPPYDPSQYNWMAVPADADPPCLKCYKWGRFPPGQRHLGYIWQRICQHDCSCEHHKVEVWMADISKSASVEIGG